ncbi:hypothetical protein PoB_000351300 [Plakobranchus ocellatus]|uniref:Uncharacterized protein n=1 Tax=Plakobranchus ocellatus TaxID=259542 RepID=A0AAV3Y3T3_9GAST|nr:hypothetical protein PoB_000351300 [Plakobranchus ocellatus]
MVISDIIYRQVQRLGSAPGLTIPSTKKLRTQWKTLSTQPQRGTHSCLSSSSAERLPNKATVKGGDTPTKLAGCKSVRHKSDENSRAGLPLALSSYTTGVLASCEDDGCHHSAGSPTPVASPSPSATKGDHTSPCLFHTLEDPHRPNHLDRPPSVAGIPFPVELLRL